MYIKLNKFQNRETVEYVTNKYTYNKSKGHIKNCYNCGNPGHFKRKYGLPSAVYNHEKEDYMPARGNEDGLKVQQSKKLQRKKTEKERLCGYPEKS